MMLMVVSGGRLGSRSLRRGGRMGMEGGGQRQVAKVREAGATAVEGGLRGGLFEQMFRRGWKVSEVDWMEEIVV